MRASSFTLFVFASLGLASSIAACSGAIEPQGSPSPAAEAGATTNGRDASSIDEDSGTPPLRDVTTPVTIDLGEVASGQEVTFVVPPNALGFNVVVEGKTPSTPVAGVERITSPSGEIVHDAYTPKGGNHATSESSWGPIASASVPQSEAKSANPPEPGTWKVRFGGAGTEPPPPPPPLDAGLGGSDGGVTGPATMRAKVRVQIGSATGFVGGRLDLRVYIPKGLRLDGKTLDAATAGADTGIQRRLDTFFGALSTHVGIDRGDVTFHAADARLAFVDDEASLADGFAASSVRPDGEQALHLLLTNGIDFGDGNAAWGIAPGIPGAATRTGTTMSGIILAIDDTPAIGDGLTILHEGGHFFGLNHTTEFYGGYSDPLTDTPKCETISLDDPSSITSCPDKMNVMFPAFYGTAGNAIRVSDAQARVYRGSPIYKAYAQPAQGTMAERSGASPSLASLARPGERITLTKSGRPLGRVETWLSASLCSHVKLDAKALERALGRDAALAGLRAAAADADLPNVMRKKAAGALRAIE